MQKADITIHQGDDTDFMGQINRWYLPDGDYTQWKARYSVGAIVKDTTIQSGTDEGGNPINFVAFVLSANDTASLEVGNYTAALKLYDENGKCQTVITSTLVKILPMEVNNNGI
nr:MAG TPA: hypothetical protein [Caudoviricetes sp.]